MNLNKKHIHPFFWVLFGSVSLLALQSVWIHRTYQLEHNQLMVELKEALSLAYQKEQTYRIPVVDLVTSGEVTMQSCGEEEIIVVRKCTNADTIVYKNISGSSIEKFINRVFWDLREQIVPMNTYCLSDLFAGMLHDKDIPLLFIIERYNIKSNEILETSSISDEKQQIHTKYESTIIIEISDTEAIRALIQIMPGVIFKRMGNALAFTFLLVGIVLVCVVLLCRAIKQRKNIQPINPPAEQASNTTFHIGKYCFDPFKNELQGFNETIQLNKKENAILHALCMQQGNVVERNSLLDENWGSSGIIYSRSLDTYLATLRKYLKKDPDIQIITIKGVGYKLICTKETHLL